MEIHQERFEAWLFNQPRGRTFNYMSNFDCALCAFFKETSKATPVAGSATLDLYEGSWATGAMIASFVIPEWATALLSKRSGGKISAGVMQDAYLKMFPDRAAELLPEREEKEGMSF